MARRRYRGRRRRRRRKKKTKIPAQFPAPTQVVKLRYADSIQLDAGVATSAYHFFRANSCYDPDESGTGHQPLGFDEWTTFYNKYCVLGSRITVIFNTDSNTTGINQLVALSLQTDTTRPTYPTTLIEDPQVATRVLNGVYNGTAGLVTLRKNYSSKRYHNVSDPMLLDNQQAYTAYNPADPVRYCVQAWNLDGGDPPNIHCTVIIDYIVKFSEPENLLRSV